MNKILILIVVFVFTSGTINGNEQLQKDNDNSLKSGNQITSDNLSFVFKVKQFDNENENSENSSYRIAKSVGTAGAVMFGISNGVYLTAAFIIGTIYMNYGPYLPAALILASGFVPIGGPIVCCVSLGYMVGNFNDIFFGAIIVGVILVNVDIAGLIMMIAGFASAADAKKISKLNNSRLGILVSSDMSGNTNLGMVVRF